MNESAVETSPLTMFDECVRDIEAEYGRLEHQLGWRFLMVSRSVLDKPANVALITINPAGSTIPPDHPWDSCEAGVAYLVERWHGSDPGQDTLQVQVQALFRMLAQALAFKGSFQELMAKSLMSQFIPFRSPRIKKLPQLKDAYAFGRDLWRRILRHAAPRLIICLGREVQCQLQKLIPAEQGTIKIGACSYPTGWGSHKADVDEYETPRGVVRLLYLPHLSRFQLFAEPRLESLSTIVRAACDGLTAIDV